MWEPVEKTILLVGFTLVVVVDVCSLLLATRLYKGGKSEFTVLIVNLAVTSASVIAACTAASFVANIVNDKRAQMAGESYNPIFNGERKLGPILIWLAAMALVVVLSNIVGVVLIARAKRGEYK